MTHITNVFLQKHRFIDKYIRWLRSNIPRMKIIKQKSLSLIGASRNATIVKTFLRTTFVTQRKVTIYIIN